MSQIIARHAAASPLGAIAVTGSAVRQKIALKSTRVFGMYALVYILDGNGYYADDNGLKRDIRAGDLIVIFPDIGHIYNPAKGTTWLTSYVAFYGPVFDLWRAQGLLDVHNPVYHLEPVRDWTRRLDLLFEGQKAGGFAPPLLEICRLQHLLADIISGAGYANLYQNDLRWAARACNLLEAGLIGDPHWDQIAREFGLGGEAFRKRFTRLVGQPPARYRMRRLIDRACEMMQRREMNDKQIAEALGFCDEYYFSRRFKTVTGQSPRQFRQSLLERLQ